MLFFSGTFTVLGKICTKNRNFGPVWNDFKRKRQNGRTAAAHAFVISLQKQTKSISSPPGCSPHRFPNAAVNGNGEKLRFHLKTGPYSFMEAYLFFFFSMKMYRIWYNWSNLPVSEQLNTRFPHVEVLWVPRGGGFQSNTGWSLIENIRSRLIKSSTLPFGGQLETGLHI